MRIVQFLILILLSSTNYAQVFSEISKEDLTYSISYFGNNLWNEGVGLGVSSLNNEYIKTTKKGKERSIVKSYSASLNTYQDNDAHSAVFVTAGWSKKKIFPNRFNVMSSAEPFGIYRSFLPETYKIKDGEIKSVFLPGRFYLASSVSAGVGRISKNNPNNGWFTRVNVTALYPYSRAIVPLVNVEFGYHFKLNTSK